MLYSPAAVVAVVAADEEAEEVSRVILPGKGHLNETKGWLIYQAVEAVQMALSQLWIVVPVFESA